MKAYLKLLLAAAAFGVLVHPLGAGVTELFGRTDAFSSLFAGGPSKALSRMAFFLPFATVPVLGLALLVLPLRGPARRFPPLRWALDTAVVAGALLSLAAQVLAWVNVRSDAQSALLFIFLPLYAGLAAGLLAGLVFLVGYAVWVSRQRRDAQS
ncbi:hypothetical protein [Archangium sp.]|uniref:hypothetical protein n=1 Tax=Archangium sp. TaxID=1872627 RepID=UPI002ED89C15